MFHVPILLLRLGNMLLMLLLLLSCVPHWTCVTRRFSFFAYQLTLISLFVDEGKWERNGKFMRTHCCCCCCCCFKWCGWGWPFYLNGILMRKDCTIVCLFFTYTGAVLVKDTHGITDRFPKDVSITNRRPQCLSTGGVGWMRRQEEGAGRGLA